MGAGSENTVRRVLRELAGERSERSPWRSVARRGDIDHLVRARSGVGYAIGAGKRRLDDRHVVRARDAACARSEGLSGAAGLSTSTARVIIIPVDRLVRALVRLATGGQLAARILIRCAG